MSMGYSTQDKLAEAIRILKEADKYALDRPVQKRNVRPPILTVFKQVMQEQRGAK